MHGITITLWEKAQTGIDPLGEPIYSEVPTDVDDVLVAPASGTDIVEQLQLYGKHAVYTLGIPKGDAHTWEGRKVGFFGDTFRVIGKPTQGIEENIPLRWNKKVKVERYE